MNKLFAPFLPPWAETGLQPAFYDLESGTVLQQTARMYDKVNQLIRLFNELSEETQTTVTEYINKFTELKDFVDNYFENLDVQEEINNKLDAMVEDGTLQALFAGYGLEIGEDNKVKVKAGTGITVDENGVSETPYTEFIEGVEVKKVDYTNDVTGTSTTIYYSIVPADYIPKLYMADPDNPNVAKVPSDCDFNYKPTLMINGSPWDTSTHEAYGPLIIDGDIKVENNLSGGSEHTRTIFAIDEDGYVRSYERDTEAEDVDAVSAGRAWQTVINNGLDLTAPMITDKDPRTFFGQATDGRYIIGVCGGRVWDDTGMQVQDIADFLFYHVDGFTPRVAFNMDGGGSSALLYKGIRQNPLVGREDRACPSYLVFSSPTAKDNGVFEAQSATNAGLIHNFKETSTGYMDIAGLNERKAEGMTISSGFLRSIDGMVAVLQFEFSLDSNLTAYTKLLTNLPTLATTASQYFYIMKKASDNDNNNQMRQVYIVNASAPNNTSLVTRFAMPAGDYTVSIVYATKP